MKMSEGVKIYWLIDEVLLCSIDLSLWRQRHKFKQQRFSVIAVTFHSCTGHMYVKCETVYRVGHKKTNHLLKVRNSCI